MSEIVILGSGMAGLGAAHRLSGEKVSARIYEKEPEYGGHTRSYKFESGFIFDDGPHISFTKDKRIQELFAESVNGEFEILQAKVNNYWRGHWIKHPAQCNLHGLPPELVAGVLEDFVDAKYREPGEIRNYRDWLYARFGKRFSETFPIEYGLKYHTTGAENMTTDWLGPRIYQPDLNEVFLGALSAVTPDVHYVDHFRYPTRNGFVSYLDRFARKAEIVVNREAVAIDPKAKTVRFSDQTETPYTALVSSVPLPELIPLIEGAPSDVVEAAGKLACTTCVMVNVGIDREDISDATWTYFYDRDFLFTRLSFPHLMSPNNVPPGCGSIQAEIYFSRKYKPLDRKPEDCVEPVLADLRRCGLIREEDTILHTNVHVTPYANVIFDLDRPAALETVHGYLDDVGIAYCGRYGDWAYHWTDEAFKSGELAAERSLKALRLGNRS